MAVLCWGQGAQPPKSCLAPQFLIGSIVIWLSRCCLPNDEGPLLHSNSMPGCFMSDADFYSHSPDGDSNTFDIASLQLLKTVLLMQLH